MKTAADYSTLDYPRLTGNGIMMSGALNSAHSATSVSMRPEKKAGLLVIAFGLTTTAITLILVYLLNQIEIQPMGFYIFYLVPIGAFLVGLAAGSGYGLGSWLTGAKIGGTLLVMVIVMQTIAYFAMQYAEFAMIKNQVAGNLGFGTWFDLSTRAFTFEGGRPLGVWGYGIRVLEILGFSVGGITGPLILMSKPYCADCQVYCKTKQLGLLPAGVQPRKVKKKDPEAQATYEAEIAEALSGGMQLIEETAEMAQSGQAGEFCDLLQDLRKQKKEISKQTTRLNVALEYCPNCRNGRLIYQTMQGQGEEINIAEVGSYEVNAAIVGEVLVKL